VVHAQRTAAHPDKSLIIGTTAQLHGVASAISSVAVAGVELPVAEEMKILGIVLDRRLTFEKHVTMVARSCHYHAQAPTHTPLTVNGAGIDTGAQPDTDEAGLL